LTISDIRASIGRAKGDLFAFAIVDKDVREVLDFCADVETVPNDILTGLSYFSLRDNSHYLLMSFSDVDIRDHWLEEAEALGFKVFSDEPDVSVLVKQSRIAFVGNFSAKMLEGKL
jgi:hypothetical protein